MRGRQRIAACLAPAAVAWLALTAPALGRTFEVNRTSDPAPDGCTRSECTLREAIIAANVRPGGDEVILRSGRRYELAQPGADDVAMLGDLDVLSPLRVGVSARRRATIDANDLDRIFDFRGSGGSLSRLEITGGLVTGGQRGGAVAGDAPVRIVRSRVVGNRALTPGGTAGGVYLLAGGAIKRSLIAGNEATSNAGGLWVFGEEGDPFVIDRSRIEGNEAGSGPGGAGVNDARVSRTVILRNTAGSGCGGISAGDARVTASRIVRNESLSLGGGGICQNAVGPRVELIRSRVLRNESAFNGGGVNFGFASFAIVASTIAGNSAAGHGGGIFASVAQPLEIRGSTVSGNTAGGTGGGIRAESATELELTNSTIAGNRAAADGGGIFAINPSGGNPTVVTLAFTTIVRNVADADENFSGVGGGIANGLDASYVSRGTLIGRNVGNDPDCFALVDSQGRNLISVETGACNGFDGPGDLTGNPRIGSLGRNGGPTATVSLKRASPAVNAAGTECPARDQRGRRRPQGPRCDIGAFERDQR
jgi:CSLREA domain-containing protein